MKSISYKDNWLQEVHTGVIIKFFNCRFVRNGLPVGNEDLWVLDGKVLNPHHVFFELKQGPEVEVDCQGLILTAGFIDLQVNGAFGVDFTSCAPNQFVDSLHKVAAGLTQFGITAFCPHAMISSNPDVYKSLIPLAAKASLSSSGGAATILGLHLEGPFISNEKRGCHSIQNIVSDFGENPAQTIAHTYGQFTAQDVAIVTLAPELPGSLDAIKYFRDKGVHVSLGHSAGNLDEGQRAMQGGARLVTHMFNALKPFHHRQPGLIGLLTCAPPALTLPFELPSKTCPSGLVLVSDCISALGLKDGVHKLGDENVHVTGDLAVRENGVVAGSVAKMPHCIRTLKKCVECSLEEALKCATTNPATALGIQAKMGSLDYGSVADFVLIDEQVKVHATFVSATRCFLNE
uniref:N-acetylglucosamine-6-phosphate deacetylase n=1 Tax=Ditylenchus dipsaci TaxID=166011 RepID=A0A915D205_9BILA